MKNKMIEFIKENSVNEVYMKCDLEFYTNNRELIVRGIERKLFIPCNFDYLGYCDLIFTKWVGADMGV